MMLRRPDWIIVDDPLGSARPSRPLRQLGRAPVLVLLEEALDALTRSRPLCQQQLPVDGDPTPAALRCDLPAGHHSEEHYDRASGRVWLLPGRVPHPAPEPGPPDQPWPDRP